MKPSKHPHAKLTAEQVRAIREEYVWMSKEHGANALAKKYGIVSQNIIKIVKYKTYKSV